MEELEEINFEKEAKEHPKLEDCKDEECMICGYIECPHNEPLHFHHDGCPACFAEEWKNLWNCFQYPFFLLLALQI